MTRVHYTHPQKRQPACGNGGRHTTARYDVTCSRCAAYALREEAAAMRKFADNLEPPYGTSVRASLVAKYKREQADALDAEADALDAERPANDVGLWVKVSVEREVRVDVPPGYDLSVDPDGIVRNAFCELIEEDGIDRDDVTIGGVRQAAPWTCDDCGAVNYNDCLCAASAQIDRELNL